MAFATTATSGTHTNDGQAGAARAMGAAWSSYLFHAVALAGALTVIAGSYMTWATFYAGLISRNGVPGHGKYFIGLAAATILLVALSAVRGVSPALRWLVVPAGVAIAWFAFRDLQNLNALIRDPNAGFYIPGRGDGLYVVIAGGIIMAVSVFTSSGVPRLGSLNVRRTLAVFAALAGVAMLVPALYGEYYMHVSSAHVHEHGAFNIIHILSVTGPLALFAALRLGVMGLRPSRDRSAQP